MESKFRYHLKGDCKLKYSDAEIMAFKQKSEARTRAKARLRRSQSSSPTKTTEDEKYTLDKTIVCKSCHVTFPSTTFLKHLLHTHSKCKSAYNKDEISEFQNQAVVSRRASKRASDRILHQTNPKKYDSTKYSPTKRAEKYNLEKKTKDNQRKRRHEAEILKNLYKRVQKFDAEIKYGLSFVCICCERILFARTVFAVRERLLNHLGNNNLSNCVNLDDRYQFLGEFYICKSDYDCLTKKKKMPDHCFLNELQVPNVPPTLQGLHDMELQMLARDLMFVKYRQLPVTRMKAINDRVICVPLEDDDVIKNVNKLPRNKDNNGLVWVIYKRQKNKKSHYLSEMVRPERVYEALQSLVDHHPAYKNIEVDKFAILDDILDCDDKEVDDNESILDSESDLENNDDINNDKCIAKAMQRYYTAIRCE